MAYKKLNQQNLDQTRSECAKINKKEWTDYLSNKCPKFGLILMIHAHSFGLYPLSKVILYRLLSFGGMLAVRYLEKRGVRFSEFPDVLFLWKEQSEAWNLSTVHRLSPF